MRITDILDCIEKIERYTRGYDFSDFEEDPKTVILFCAIWASLGRLLATFHAMLSCAILIFPGPKCGECATLSFMNIMA